MQVVRIEKIENPYTNLSSEKMKELVEKKFRKNNSSTLDEIFKRNIKHPEEARKKADEIFNAAKKAKLTSITWKDARTGFIYFAKKRVNNFIIDSNNEEQINQILAYFINDEKVFTGDLNKGLLLSGKSGTGKTIIMKVMADFCNAFFESPKYSIKIKRYNIIECQDIVSQYRTKGDIIFNYFRQNNRICLNDLGKELEYAKEISNYGNKENPIGKILELKYNNFQDNKITIFATSNFPLTDEKGIEIFEKLYGPRINDRMFEMFNNIIFQGKSRRRK